MVSRSPPGFTATKRPASSRIAHGGFIQLSGLYALASACTAMEPSALSSTRRNARGSRAPRRPSYSTEQSAISTRIPAYATGPSRRDRASPSGGRMGLNSGIYKLLLVLHIFCAIVGFGAVYLNAIYGRQIQKRQGREGLAIFEANFRVSEIGQYFIYGVFVFGFLLVLSS